MIDFNASLNTNITNSCPQIVGVHENAYIVPRKSIQNKYLTDVECVFDIIDNLISVFVPGDLPYKPTSSGKNLPRGIVKYDKTVEFFFLENTALTQKQILQLQNDSWVLVFKDNNEQNLVFGLESGLKFKSSSQEFNSTDTHGGIVVVMEELNVNVPMIFTTNAIYDLINYEFVHGLTIGNTGVFVAQVDPTTKITVKGNTNYFESSLGLINAMLDLGTIEVITIKYDKRTSILNLGDTNYNDGFSNVTGSLKVDFSGNLSIDGCVGITSVYGENVSYFGGNGCTGLTKVHLPSITYGDFENCGLSASLIESILLEIVFYGNYSGTLILVGNYSYILWTAKTKKYYDILISRGWTITKSTV